MTADDADGGAGGGGKPIVFLSYSHKDEDWKKRQHPYLKALEQAERLELWDDTRIGTGADWYNEISASMHRAAVAVMLVSQHYLSSDFITKEEIPYFIERREQNGLVNGLVVVPLLLRPCPWKAFRELARLQMLPGSGKNVQFDFEGRWEIPLSEVADVILEKLDDPAFQPTKPRTRSAPEPVTATPKYPPLTEDRIDITRLPQTGAALFGRQEELRWLDEAWDNHTAHVVSLIAWGGVGKSTLVNKWLEGMRAAQFRGARRVFGWSFYSQGTNDTTSSADAFIAAALKWFGDPDPAAGSPWYRGERLAGLVRQERTLLLLDGLESLQWGDSTERGRIKDPALAMLVAELAGANPGLCVLTSRQPVADLEDYPKDAQKRDLTLMSPEAGRALLRVGGVRGSDAELEDASRAFGGHALALSLLAAWLHGLPGHHVAKAAAIPACDDLPLEQGRHPRRVMEAWAARFGAGPELELLRLLGLFDRPADANAIAALRAPPVIPHLTDRLGALSEGEWLRLVERLRAAGLVARQSHHDPKAIDAHPLVREHFGRQLRETHPEAWRAGHRRRYEYLANAAKPLPETMEDMAPLYAAVAHGCMASCYREALNEIFMARIRRGRDVAYSLQTLGTFGADLADLMALSFFFDPPKQWRETVAELTEAEKAFVRGAASYSLRVLGRLDEAIQARQASFDAYFDRKDYRGAAYDATHLAKLYLMLGRLPEVERAARQGVDLPRGIPGFIPVENNATLAHILHEAGRIPQAEALFRKAEEEHRRFNQRIPYLYSSQAFQYYELLLEIKRWREVEDRVRVTLKLADLTGDGPRARALGHLSLGRAYLLAAEEDKEYIPHAKRNIEDAIECLREIRRQDIVPIGLLSRAALCRLTGSLPEADKDVDRALIIAKRRGMRLHETDAHLEYARLCLAKGERDKARQHLETARAAVARLGYHRRDPEVAELERQLG